VARIQGASVTSTHILHENARRIIVTSRARKAPTPAASITENSLYRSRPMVSTMIPTIQLAPAKGAMRSGQSHPGRRLLGHIPACGNTTIQIAIINRVSATAPQHASITAANAFLPSGSHRPQTSRGRDQNAQRAAAAIAPVASPFRKLYAASAAGPRGPWSARRRATTDKAESTATAHNRWPRPARLKMAKPAMGGIIQICGSSPTRPKVPPLG